MRTSATVVPHSYRDLHLRSGHFRIVSSSVVVDLRHSKVETAAASFHSVLAQRPRRRRLRLSPQFSGQSSPRPLALAPSLSLTKLLSAAAERISRSAVIPTSGFPALDDSLLFEIIVPFYSHISRTKRTKVIKDVFFQCCAGAER